MSKRYVLRFAALGLVVVAHGALMGADPASGTSPVLPYLVLQAGPEESVTSVAVSPDGGLVASGSVSGADYRSVKVWDVEGGRLLATLVSFSESRAARATDDWLAYTSDGAYDGSPNVDRFLA